MACLRHQECSSACFVTVHTSFPCCCLCVPCNCVYLHWLQWQHYGSKHRFKRCSKCPSPTFRLALSWPSLGSLMLCGSSVSTALPSMDSCSDKWEAHSEGGENKSCQRDRQLQQKETGTLRGWTSVEWVTPKWGQLQPDEGGTHEKLE